MKKSVEKINSFDQLFEVLKEKNPDFVKPLLYNRFEYFIKNIKTGEEHSLVTSTEKEIGSIHIHVDYDWEDNQIKSECKIVKLISSIERAEIKS